jgi:DNA-directed RNA polymerase subunit RPC12/RpoP
MEKKETGVKFKCTACSCTFDTPTRKKHEDKAVNRCPRCGCLNLKLYRKKDLK